MGQRKSLVQKGNAFFLDTTLSRTGIEPNWFDSRTAKSCYTEANTTHTPKEEGFMKIGICAPPQYWQAAKELGYDDFPMTSPSKHTYLAPSMSSPTVIS